MNNTENKINWKQKLTSRKLWCAIAAAVLSAVAVLMGEEIPAEAAALIEKGVYGLIAYIFGESFVDAIRIYGKSKVDAASAVPININFGETEAADKPVDGAETVGE